MAGPPTRERLRDVLAKRKGGVYNAGGSGMSDDPLRHLGEFSGIGFTLVAYVLVFTAIGYGLDRLLGTRPWLMVVGVFVGAALGFTTMIRMLLSSSTKAPDDDDADDTRSTRPRER